MSNASQKTEKDNKKEHAEWENQRMRQRALELAVGLVRPSGPYEPKNIAKDAHVFYQFLKGVK